MFLFISNFRLAKAFEELSEFLKNEEELKETTEYLAAQQVLEDSRPSLTD